MNQDNNALTNQVEETSSCCSTSSCCAPQAPITRDSPKVGRNDLCPCGNGRKYKKCCGKNV